MHLSLLRIPPVALALLGVTALTKLSADSVVLQGGERIEGRVVSQDADHITFEVRVTDSIFETRHFNRSEIRTVEITPEWQRAFDALSDATPGPLSRTPQDYAALIDGRLKAYLTAFPTSPKKKEIETRIAALQEEAARVEAGEVKLDGQWIPAGEATKRRAELVAEFAFREMRARTEQKDWSGALSTLARIEKESPGSRALLNAADLARQILPVFRQDLLRALDAAKRQQAQWEEGLALTPEHRRQPLVDARKREEAEYAARVAEAEVAGAWPPLIPGYTAGIEKLIDRVQKDSERIATIPVARMRESLRLTEEAGALVARKELDAAEALLAKAETAWKENNAIVLLREAIAAIRTTDAAAAAATPSPSPAAEAATPTPAAAAPAASPAPAAPTVSVPFYKKPPVIVGIAVVLAAAVGSLFVSKPQRRQPEHH